MEVKKTINGTLLTAKVSGRLDTNTSPELEEELRGSLDGITKLTMDFNDLEYISSAGLRVLLAMQKEMAGKDGMTVTGVNDTVQEIFDVTGFSDILTIE